MSGDEIVILDAGDKGRVVNYDGTLYLVFPCTGEDNHPDYSDPECMHYKVLGWALDE